MLEAKHNKFDFLSHFLKSKIKDNIFFNNPFVGITITDAQGVALIVNDSVSRITGLDHKELVGTNLYDAVKVGLVSKSSTALVMEKKEEVIIEQKVNNNRSYIAKGIPIFDDEGAIQYIVNFLIDSTEISMINQKLKKVEAENEKIKNEMKRLKKLLKSDNDIVYSSKSMDNVMRLALLAAETDAPVFLTGETGVGKGIVARYIHNTSDRNKNKFVSINCEAIPKTLLESELFGYAGGAYTGSRKHGRAGLFKEADGGTIFLDEIGEISLDIQVKLLNFLQYHTFRRVGSSFEERIDVRIIAATNADISKLIKEKKFRQDLYYRLNVVPIHIPSLEERKEDIPLLLNFYLDKFNAKYRKYKTISPEAMNILSMIEYKGNVRELENLMERLIILSGNNKEINLDDIKNCTNISPLSNIEDSFREQMDKFEKSILENYMKRYGSFQKAAEKLDLDPSTVFRKLKKHGLK